MTGEDLLSTNTGKAKKLRVTTEDDSAMDAPGDDVLETLAKNFNQAVNNKLRSTEEQLRDAVSRLEARVGEVELVICLAENRIALALDPRYLENAHKLKLAIQELQELAGQVGTVSSVQMSSAI